MTTPIIDSDPWKLVGQTVTLAGTARDAVEGAVVLLKDRTPVYVKGLHSWDDALDRKQVVVTGTLRLSGGSSEPLVNAQGEHRQGSEGDMLVIEDATWKPA
ncbi:MAG: hypothetical protein K8M05_42045 [Deltaproteobacteria bacterium]|nr:hypothetical protein [Kofleriaceae bacterium]